MSFTITVSDTSSYISKDFEVPIYLDDDPSIQYEIGLANFDSFNMIPNVDETNNVFVWGDNNQFEVKIPIGSYELNKLVDKMKSVMLQKDIEATLDIIPNNQTAKVNLTSNRTVNFQVANSIGSILGFTKRILESNKEHESDGQVKILKINTICVDCNIASGSYLNSKPVHIIHQFFPSVPYGYKIVESPLNIIYYPVSDKSINNIIVKVTDQAGNLIDFRGEEITIRLHIRKKL